MQNDSLIAQIDPHSSAAAPSSQTSVRWDVTQSDAVPGLRPKLLPGYVVRFTTETARNYSISVTLAPSERPDGGSTEPKPVPGSPFHVTVWPGKIDISQSGQPGPLFLDYVDLIDASLCGSPCRQTAAGARNNFTVVPRDENGNVQIRHPSVFALETPDAMFVRMGCSQSANAQDPTWCKYDDASATSSSCSESEDGEYTCADTRWSTAASRFETQMTNTTPTIAGVYTLDVALGYADADAHAGGSGLAAGSWGVREPFVSPSVWPQTREYAERAIPNGDTPFTVFVRPADLSHTDSGPGNAVDPDLFNSTEAGRECSFAIVPRDKYSNIRHQNVFGFSDATSVLLTPVHTTWAGAVVQEPNTTWIPNSPLPSTTTIRPHFLATFSVTASGVYRLEVMLESTPVIASSLVGLSTVPQRLVGTQPSRGYTLVVVPAALHPTNTEFINMFSSHTHGMSNHCNHPLPKCVLTCMLLCFISRPQCDTRVSSTRQIWQQPSALQFERRYQSCVRWIK